jgi:hypothetical protein
MRIALIPPIPDLNEHATTDIHLLLSHLIDRPGYLDYYRKRKRLGDYIILDNSAHEHQVGNKAHELMFQAMLLQADEVVCSDVLFDARETAHATEAMLVYITSDRGWDVYYGAGCPRLMLVPQGANERQWAWCLRELLYLWDHYMRNLATAPPVIGISKDYDNFKGGIAGIIKRHCEALRDQGVDVHCLGWPTNLWSLANVNKKTPWVRSVDSAKPFAYARAGVRLEPGGPVPPYPRRTSDFFDRPLGRWSDVARVNVEVFRAAAANELILA